MDNNNKNEGHQHRYSFRLMYFVCNNKQVIADDAKYTNAYQEKRHCEHLIPKQDKKVAPDQNPTVRSIEGFFLVHEKLWWILAPYAQFFLIKDRLVKFITGDPTKVRSKPY